MKVILEKKLIKINIFLLAILDICKITNFIFQGRKDDIINFGGRKVSCKEINKILDGIKEVSENSVISIKSKRNF